MNGNCYYSEGLNPTLTCNKNEGNRVAIPVLTPDRANKRQNGRRFKEDGEETFTLTSQDRHGVAVEVKPYVIGGIGEKNFGKQWRQGNRVYDAKKVATALESHPVGNAGGNTNLYAVEVNVEPVQMSGCELSEQSDEAHSLNCTDQRKVFGAHQKRTMVGYNATLKRGGGYDTNSAYVERKGLQRIVGEQSDDDGSGNVFAIDKGYTPKERKIANCIESREDRGISRRCQEGTLICHKVTWSQ